MDDLRVRVRALGPDSHHQTVNFFSDGELTVRFCLVTRVICRKKYTFAHGYVDCNSLYYVWIVNL